MSSTGSVISLDDLIREQIYQVSTVFVRSG